MKQALKTIRTQAAQQLASVQDLKELDSLRVKFLGKKGELTAILKQMGGLSAEERPVIGQLANEVRASIEKEIEIRTQQLKDAALNLRLKTETLDITMPGEPVENGTRHPLTIVLDELKEIFLGMGYSIAEGP